MPKHKINSIIADLHYWSYGELSEKAMFSHIEVKEEDIKRMAERYNLIIDFRNVSSLLSLGIPTPSLPKYRKVILQVIGNDACIIKNCLKEMIKIYGKPDEIPQALFGEKKVGKNYIFHTE